MNSKFLLIVLSFAGFSSCTTAYKSGQTPDDVYFSPVRPSNDRVRSNENTERTVYNSSTYDPTINNRVNNRRWRRYHDYDYGYGYNSYDPCYPGYIDPKIVQAGKYTAPRRINTGAYKKNNTNTSGNGKGTFFREIFNGILSPSVSNTGNSGGNSNTGSNSSGANNSGSKTSSTTVPVRTFGNK